MIVDFVDVGRGKASWSAELPESADGEAILAMVHREVSRKKLHGFKVLNSRDIEVTLSDDFTGAIVVAGCRRVGTFVLSATPRKDTNG